MSRYFSRRSAVSTGGEARFSRVVAGSIALALGIGLWELGWWATGGVGYAHSWDTFGALGSLLTGSDFWWAIGETLLISLVGLGLGLAIALVGGALIGSSPFIDRSSRGTLNFARSIPSVILLPLFMASVGSFGWMVVTLVATVVSFKLIVFVIRGMRDTDNQLMETGRILRLDAIERLVLISIPAASALVLTGLRLSASRAYSAVVLAGVIAGTPGIGYQIVLARLSADSALMLAYAVVAGAMGVAFFYIFSALEKRAVRWRPV